MSLSLRLLQKMGCGCFDSSSPYQRVTKARMNRATSNRGQEKESRPLKDDEGQGFHGVVGKLLDSAHLSNYLDRVLAWCEEQGAVELRELDSEFDSLTKALAFKPMERRRLQSALRRTLGSVAEAHACEAEIKGATATGAVGETKLALDKAANMKLTGKLLDSCEAQHALAERAEVAAVEERMIGVARKTREILPKNVRFVLVSSPEIALDGKPVLKCATAIVEAFGGINKAGDTSDWFHSKIMLKDEMENMKGWRIAWISRIRSYLDDARRLFPEDEIRFLTLDGGVECQWELNQLKGDIKKDYPFYKLRRFRDLSAFEEYFIAGAP